MAIAQALKKASCGSPFQAYVFIDGLPLYERQRASRYLRSFNKGIKKVRGLRDDADEFIRLADTFAGLIRAHNEGDTYTHAIYRRGLKKGVIVEVDM